MAESPHERRVSPVSPASLWPWGTRDYEDYEDYEYQENRVGRVVTKSRLDPRHVSMGAEEERARADIENSNALRLQSAGDAQTCSLLLILLSAAWAVIRL